MFGGMSWHVCGMFHDGMVKVCHFEAGLRSQTPIVAYFISPQLRSAPRVYFFHIFYEFIFQLEPFPSCDHPGHQMRTASFVSNLLISIIFHTFLGGDEVQAFSHAFS